MSQMEAVARDATVSIPGMGDYVIIVGGEGFESHSNENEIYNK